MTTTEWEHDSIEKYVIIMGQLINNVKITMEDVERGAEETIRVPVTYGPREKVLAAAERQTIDDQVNPPKVAITLPRIAFELSGAPQYDGVRMSTATSKTYLDDRSTIYNPPAYNFPFTVSIVAKSARVANRIMERIVPLFVPSLTMTIKPLKDFPNYKKEVIIELQSAVPNNTYEGDFRDRQYIGWDMTFILKGWLFGPINTQDRITRIDVNFIDDTTVDQLLSTASVMPGLTANGQPTSDATLTIPRNSIHPTDNYGYITGYTDEGA